MDLYTIEMGCAIFHHPLQPMASRSWMTRAHMVDSPVPIRKLFDVNQNKRGTHPRSSVNCHQFNAKCRIRAEAMSTARTGESADGEILIKEEGPLHNKSEYNWENEWYPLYLAAEVPKDAPLGLTVFDKQLVLYEDGSGILQCYEDRCPHRAAKLSEGQLTDGRLECLYHGWQFEGDGKCVKIPQLPSGAKIPNAACVKSYEITISQGVVWVWMAERSTADPKKLPWFDHYSKPGFRDFSSVHELPYDHSILLENLMDPAHIPISHDGTDPSAKRENAQPLGFEVTERTPRGFAGRWGEASNATFANTLRFEAPCVLRNDKEYVDKDGNKKYSSALFLCRPSGQGKSMLIVRFGSTQFNSRFTLIPNWVIHQTSNRVFEQDMGFLSSQNEILLRKKVPTKDLYLNLRSCDTWVTEYRRWLDKVGHGMPYYFGYQTFCLPQSSALLEEAPAGLVTSKASSVPTKGVLGTLHAPDPTNRYFRHVIHCKECRTALKKFQAGKQILLASGCFSAGLALLSTQKQWRVLFLVCAFLLSAGFYVCSNCVHWITTNFVRSHRR